MKEHRTDARTGLETLEARRLLAGYPLNVGGMQFDSISAAAQAPDGSVVVAGLFSGTADFQPGRAQTLLTARGDSDVFIASYSPAGKLLWAGQIGGDYEARDFRDPDRRDIPANPRRLSALVGRVGAEPRLAGEYVNGLAIGPDGSVFVAGAFRLSADLDPGPGAQEYHATGPDPDEYYDAYVLKLDGSTGALAWASVFGGRFDVVATGVAVDGSGNPHISGYFTRVADFNPGAGVFEVSAEGRDDGFVAQLSVNGKLSWVQTIGSDEVSSRIRESANDIALDAAGNVYVAGTFSGRARFENRAGASRTRSMGETDAFVASYGSDGAFRWSRATGGEAYDGNTHLAVIGNAVYTVGYFEDVVDFDPGAGVTQFRATGETFSSTRRARTDLAVSRFSTEGDFVWARQLAGTRFELAGGLTADENGPILAGSFYGEADFDPLSGTDVRTSTPGLDRFTRDRNDRNRRASYDGFVWRLSATGRHVFAETFGGPLDDHAQAITTPLTGRSYVAGRFAGTRTPAPGGGVVSSLGETDGVIGLVEV
ncbi:MAG TPA: hypothetical protein PKB10_04150 [Tepidisphaeraceae bacterium]|nr:hypothetical protein [Tepidisphaeraceae bacterium]